MRRRYRYAVAWLAVVALLGNTLAAFAPAKAAEVVDDILGPLIVCTSQGAQPLSHDGTSPSPGDQSAAHCPSCTLVKNVSLAAEFCVQKFPSPPQAARIQTSSDLRGVAFRLSLGRIGCRAPPFVA
jgi:hypothetical protein